MGEDAPLRGAQSLLPLTFCRSVLCSNTLAAVSMSEVSGRTAFGLNAPRDSKKPPFFQCFSSSTTLEALRANSGIAFRKLGCTFCARAGTAGLSAKRADCARDHFCSGHVEVARVQCSWLGDGSCEVAAGLFAREARHRRAEWQIRPLRLLDAHTAVATHADVLECVPVVCRTSLRVRHARRARTEGLRRERARRAARSRGVRTSLLGMLGSRQQDSTAAHVPQSTSEENSRLVERWRTCARSLG